MEYTLVFLCLLVNIRMVHSRSGKTINGINTGTVLHALVPDDETGNSAQELFLDSSGNGQADFLDSEFSDDEDDTLEKKSENDHKDVLKSQNKVEDDKTKRKKQKDTPETSSKQQQQQQSKTCCQNGGICVLGSFCYCPKNYEGRYCENRVRRRDCGPLKHEEVLRRGCALCRCYDGNLFCTNRPYENCANSEVQPIFFDFNQAKKSDTPNRPVLLGTNDDRQQEMSEDILVGLVELERSSGIRAYSCMYHKWLILLVVLWIYWVH